jgi:hypothetical protein
MIVSFPYLQQELGRRKDADAESPSRRNEVFLVTCDYRVGTSGNRQIENHIVIRI